MKKFGLLISFILLTTQLAWGQILTFDFAGLAGSEVTANSNSNNTNLTSSTISRGAGLTASGNQDRFNATNWAVTSIANAVSGNNYMEFTITPNSGYQFTVTSIVVQWQRSATGNTAIALRSSVDAYANDLDAVKNVTDNTSTQTFTWTFSQTNSSSAVTYRFYSYAEGTAGSGGPGDGTGNDIIVNGTVTAAGGVVDPASFLVTTSSTTQINLSWAQNGNNDNVMVAWNSTNSFGTPSGIYSVSDPIAGGGTVIYNGSGTSYNHTSLTANTAYYYKAWSVDGSVVYSAGVTSNATTLKEEPSNHVLSFTATEDGFSKIDLSWTENEGSVVPDGYLIKASTSDNVSDPVDGTAVSDNTTIGNNSGAININHGTTSCEWSGLDAETQYYFKIYPYTNSGSATDYKIDGVPAANATTGVLPVAPPVYFSEYIEGSSNNKAIEIFNGTTGAINLANYSVKLASNGGGWGTTQSLSGSLASDDVYVIYNIGAVVGITAVGDLSSGVTFFNGDDAVGLFYLDLLIDVIGTPDSDPGTAWNVAGTTNATSEYTLVRKSTITTGNTNWSVSAGTTTENSEWIVYPQDTFNYLGSHDGTPLPVELTSFSATTIGSTIKLSWNTATEINNYGFEIERSVISIPINRERNFSWEKIGFVNGNGNSNSPKDYSFVDNNLPAGRQGVSSGKYSYRLKQIDNDGQFEYSKTIEVDMNGIKKFELSQNYPNPFNPTTTIKFNLPEAGTVKLTLFNILGQELRSLVNGFKESGTHTINFDASELNSGMYIYKIESGSFTQTRKMTLVK